MLKFLMQNIPLVLKIRFIIYLFRHWRDGYFKLVLKVLITPVRELLNNTRGRSSFLDLGCGLGISSMLLAFAKPKLMITCIDKFPSVNWEIYASLFKNINSPGCTNLFNFSTEFF